MDMKWGFIDLIKNILVQDQLPVFFEEITIKLGRTWVNKNETLKRHGGINNQEKKNQIHQLEWSLI
jgi:hypothetical protein